MNTDEKIEFIKEAFIRNMVRGRIQKGVGSIFGEKAGKGFVDNIYDPIAKAGDDIDGMQKGNLGTKVKNYFTGTNSFERGAYEASKNIQDAYGKGISQEFKHIKDNATEYLSNPGKLWDSGRALMAGGRGNLKAKDFIASRQGKAPSYLGTNKRQAKKLRKDVSSPAVKGELNEIISADRKKQVKGLAVGGGGAVVGTGAWAANRNSKEKDAKRQLVQQMMAQRQQRGY